MVAGIWHGSNQSLVRRQRKRSATRNQVSQQSNCSSCTTESIKALAQRRRKVEKVKKSPLSNQNRNSPSERERENGRKKGIMVTYQSRRLGRPHLHHNVFRPLQLPPHQAHPARRKRTRPIVSAQRPALLLLHRLLQPAAVRATHCSGCRGGGGRRRRSSSRRSRRRRSISSAAVGAHSTHGQRRRRRRRHSCVYIMKQPRIRHSKRRRAMRRERRRGG